jgi:D-lactate dehydrogenase
MKVAFFSFHDFEQPYYENSRGDFSFFEEKLTQQTTALAMSFPVISCFAHDELGASTLEALSRQGTKFIALRSAGFNHVDLRAAHKFGIKVARVPKYSPYSVAEHAVALILSLNRKIHRAYQRVREQNFSLTGLKGFDLHDKKVGIIGTGNIGKAFAKIMLGFGCQIQAFDPIPDQDCIAFGVQYMTLDQLYESSDIISIHCPLNDKTYHLIDKSALAKMKDHVMLINTSRGRLLDSKAVIEALKSHKVGYLGIDVYEEEEHLFFSDHSDDIIDDDVFVRLQTFPNVLITAHQGFFTHEALSNIAETTIRNIEEFTQNKLLTNEVKIS